MQDLEAVLYFQFFTRYGPDYELHLKAGNRCNLNTEDKVCKVLTAVEGVLLVVVLLPRQSTGLQIVQQYVVSPFISESLVPKPEARFETM